MIEFYEVLSMLMAAIQMLSAAFLAACFPIVLIDAVERLNGL